MTVAPASEMVVPSPKSIVYESASIRSSANSAFRGLSQIFFREAVLIGPLIYTISFISFDNALIRD